MGHPPFGFPRIKNATVVVPLTTGLVLLAIVVAPLAKHMPVIGTISSTLSMHHPDVARALAQAPEFDQQFIDMMVPHHQGAVEMALIAQSRAEHQEIKSLVADVIRSQSDEIDQMKAWRLAWYGNDQTPPMDRMPMLHSMPGADAMSMTMNMAQDVESLRQAAEPFDRAFIDAMIPHHQSAIDAGRLALQQATRQEIRMLAAAIIRAQQLEIDQMSSWRQAWYGTSDAPQAPRDMPMDMPGMVH
jgi:uncharacterized protein (DUF305 family)